MPYGAGDRLPGKTVCFLSFRSFSQSPTTVSLRSKNSLLHLTVFGDPITRIFDNLSWIPGGTHLVTLSTFEKSVGTKARPHAVRCQQH